VVVVATALLVVGLVLVLGHWRVQLRKNGLETPVRSSWAKLSLNDKRRLLASADFAAGLEAEAARFSRTRRSLEAAIQRIDEQALDSLFATYLSELRRSDYWANPQEWRMSLERIQSWLLRRSQ
jgi:hypothetical protein